jgi:hypothetical protein
VHARWFLAWTVVGVGAAISFVSFGGGALAWPIVAVSGGLLAVASDDQRRVSRAWAIAACVLAAAALPAIALDERLLPLLSCLAFFVALDSGVAPAMARLRRGLRASIAVGSLAVIAGLVVPHANAVALCSLGLAVFVGPVIMLDGWRPETAGAAGGAGVLLVLLGRPAAGSILIVVSALVAAAGARLVPAARRVTRA